jgi:hypothetical protein
MIEANSYVASTSTRSVAMMEILPDGAPLKMMEDISIFAMIVITEYSYFTIKPFGAFWLNF